MITLYRKAYSPYCILFLIAVAEHIDRHVLPWRSLYGCYTVLGFIDLTISRCLSIKHASILTLLCGKILLSGSATLMEEVGTLEYSPKYDRCVLHRRARLVQLLVINTGSCKYSTAISLSSRGSVNNTDCFHYCCALQTQIVSSRVERAWKLLILTPQRQKVGFANKCSRFCGEIVLSPLKIRFCDVTATAGKSF